ncbi:hypothetical protein JTE90_006986 [Oedothorax gibbosus]|uniref:Uncharacterized protein n=1 Tax=Oedothorax gibbosus TaxID=931172 RepID=A0AAV6V8T1_9ARAC|nr:hypothetical protein JTE90_006986 [Oedothorax gibbosus]
MASDNRYHKNCKAIANDFSSSKEFKEKTIPANPFVQTTKKLFDVGDDERLQNYQEAYLEKWKGRIAKEATAADEEYYKFTLDPPSEDFMRVPQKGESFYYIPEQHLQWAWTGRRLQRKSIHELEDQLKYCGRNKSEPRASSDSKYAFDNGIYKILIR